METYYKIIWIIAVTWIIAEAIKFITDWIKSGKPKWRIMLAYGGMPSSHTTFVTSIPVTFYLTQGIGIGAIIGTGLAIIVIRDVITIRAAIDLNTESIAKLSKNKMKGRILSHTIFEIFAGFLLGIIAPIVLNSII